MKKSPTISIIIPTLNEEGYLPVTVTNTLKCADDPDRLEVLVVDAGSTDQTIKSIEGQNTRIFVKPEFVLKKHKSLNFGIEQAAGDVLIFLDADTILPIGYDTLVLKMLDQPNVVGGAFEFSFDHSDWKLRLLQRFNRIRYRFGHMYYGDQAVFCLKSTATEVGRYPPKDLMESAYFCKRLLTVGKLGLIKSPVKTSARRFITNGFFKVFWFDFTMWIRFVLNMPVEQYGKRYWGLNLESDG